MYLCYIDETGSRDPRTRIPQRDGTVKEADWLYVLTALCVFEQRWHTFEKAINRHKRSLIDRICASSAIRLELADLRNQIELDTPTSREGVSSISLSHNRRRTADPG